MVRALFWGKALSGEGVQHGRHLVVALLSFPSLTTLGLSAVCPTAQLEAGTSGFVLPFYEQH